MFPQFTFLWVIYKLERFGLESSSDLLGSQSVKLLRFAKLRISKLRNNNLTHIAIRKEPMC
ncbi:hypothetical protein LEP1GSC040_3872 [Leptospira santarosai str. 2000030832]|uniref:Uncharacterized protein n=1 Tax=Leptospira santarosai serovar Arenal str. MAVJ 401 TaxID=1049976 RepID=M6JQA5_9LEPT|nr:hypothetical protein LEP1GSC040_3872 [Leptospira santarosai str. 2000030832]EMN21760.1 hypothetical protein LEP1GSC063_3735 [Leptospira santarosai serovar Arenal str. MAVJ 401]